MPPERKTTLWRVISLEELKSIQKLKRFSLLKLGAEVKQFTTTYDLACNFSMRIKRLDSRENIIVMTSINTSLLKEKTIFVDGPIETHSLNKKQISSMKEIYLAKELIRIV